MYYVYGVFWSSLLNGVYLVYDSCLHWCFMLSGSLSKTSLSALRPPSASCPVRWRAAVTRSSSPLAPSSLYVTTLTSSSPHSAKRQRLSCTLFPPETIVEHRGLLQVCAVGIKCVWVCVCVCVCVCNWICVYISVSILCELVDVRVIGLGYRQTNFCVRFTHTVVSHYFIIN